MGFTVEVAGKTRRRLRAHQQRRQLRLRLALWHLRSLRRHGRPGRRRSRQQDRRRYRPHLLPHLGSTAATFPRLANRSDGITDRANHLGSAIQLANQAVHDAATAHAAQAGMGSTVVAVSIERQRHRSFPSGTLVTVASTWCAVDDIEQLTNDHSLVMEQVRRGLITLAEARVSKMQNIIIQALGSGSHGEARPRRPDGIPGTCLILCSDGLTRHVPDDSMAEVFTNTLDLQQACNMLIEAASDGGGEDNVTCLLLRFVDQPWYKKFFGSCFRRSSPKWQNSI